MNPLAILSLISDLFDQLKLATDQNNALRKQVADQAQTIEHLQSAPVVQEE